MTADEWRTSDDPDAMLRAVLPRASIRKRRLFACACGRLVWDQLPEGLLRQAVEAGERCANGLLPDDQSQAFITRLYAPWRPPGPPVWFDGRVSRDEMTAFFAAKLSVIPEAAMARLPSSIGWDWLSRVARPQLAELLREVFGPAAGDSTAFDPTWRSPEAITLGGHVYHDRSFDLLPELADVLEVTGCRDAAIVSHCQSGGPHVRGCWVIDSLLGKG